MRGNPVRNELRNQGLLGGPIRVALTRRRYSRAGIRKGRRGVVKLTSDDLLDLGRWHFIQFRDSDTASAAMERYRRYLERRRDVELSELQDDSSQRDDLAA